jgi:hypothetical protein
LVLPPEIVVSSQFHLVSSSNGALLLLATQNFVRSFWPGWSLAPCTSFWHSVGTGMAAVALGATSTCPTIKSELSAAAISHGREVP